MGKNENKKNFEYIWSDRKRTAFGLPLSFTRYFLTETKLICRTGFLNIVEEEINLYKLTDKKMELSLFERLFKCGSIIVFSKDTDTPVMKIDSVRNPYDVSKLIDEKVDAQRDKYKIRGRDMVDANCDHYDYE